MGRLITSPLCHAQSVGQEHLCFALRLLALRPGPPTQSSLGPLVCTAGPGPPGRLSLAVSALALCPFSTALLMPAAALLFLLWPRPIHLHCLQCLPQPLHGACALAFACPLLPCRAYALRRAASCVGSNPGNQRPWALARLSFAENCGPALALRYCLMHPWMGQMPWLHRGNGRIAGGLGMLFRHQL